MKRKTIICFPIFLFYVASCFAQTAGLKTISEFELHGIKPWGVEYDGNNLWISGNNGKIYKVNTSGILLDSTAVLNSGINGITFAEGDLWVVGTKAVTDSLINSVIIPVYSLYKVNISTGAKTDSIHISAPGSAASFEYLWGLCWFKSKFYVSYNGGWGACLYETDPIVKSYTRYCCTHLCGMTVIGDTIWAIRHNSTEGKGNSIAIVTPTFNDEQTIYSLDFYASDLAFDGQYFWISDPDAGKIRKMIPDTKTAFSPTYIRAASNSFEISPNPANDFVTINPTISPLEIESIMITDLSGRRIKKVDKVEKTIDIRDLIPGTYLIHVISKNGDRVTCKLIRE